MLKRFLVQKSLIDDFSYPIHYRRTPLVFGPSTITDLEDDFFSNGVVHCHLSPYDYLLTKIPLPGTDYPYGYASNYEKRKYILSPYKFYDFLTQYPSTDGGSDVQNFNILDFLIPIKESAMTTRCPIPRDPGFPSQEIPCTYASNGLKHSTSNSGPEDTSSHEAIFQKNGTFEFYGYASLIEGNHSCQIPAPILGYKPLVSNKYGKIPFVSDYGYDYIYDCGSESAFGFNPRCTDPSYKGYSYVFVSYASNGDKNYHIFGPMKKGSIITTKLGISDPDFLDVAPNGPRTKLFKNYFFLAPMKKDSIITTKLGISDPAFLDVAQDDEENIFFHMDNSHLT